jgi:putative phosphoesterase
MELGLISDIHGKLPAAAVTALQGCDHLICAGDMVDHNVLWELEAIAPTTAVLGNNDCGDWGPDVGFSASPTFDGVKFFVVHRPEDVGMPAPDVQVVVHGHTHVPRNEVVNGVRYLNPGSCTRPRHGSAPSVMRLEIENGAVSNICLIDLRNEDTSTA